MENEIINPAAPAVIRAIKIGNCKFEFTENQRGKPVARYYKMMSSGKNKGEYKLIEGYFFQSEARRSQWVTKKIADIKSWAKDAEDKKAAKKAARADMKHGFEVGQIFYESWGYDQTNIDFYQIIAVKEKSVVIQEIGASRVSGTAGHDSVNVKPDPKNVCGKPMTKVIQVSVWDGKANYRIKGAHSFSGSLSPYSKGENGVYSSWGH